MAKKIFIQELEGTRRRGRPRKRWKEEVERDFQVLGMRRWRELVADRKKWKDRPKPTVGCSAKWKKNNNNKIVCRFVSIGLLCKMWPTQRLPTRVLEQLWEVTNDIGRIKL